MPATPSPQFAAPYWLLALVLALGVYLRTDLLNGPLIQPHLFRQAQTASEIDFFVRDGLSKSGRARSSSCSPWVTLPPRRCMCTSARP